MFDFIGFTGRKAWMGATAIIALAAAPAVHAQVQAQTIHFQIPAQPLAQALAEFSRQTGMPVMVASKLVEGKTSDAIAGDYTPTEALSLMLKSTDLSPSHTTAGGFVLSSITEVTITGSHIRNANPTSPVHVVTRKDIDQSGYSEVGDLMRSLPENFSGGQNPGVINGGSSNIGNQNYANASTVNLRGLGTDATLVLVNGRRLSANAFFQGSDISGIPIAAIQRVEVVSDGASALYGSDAVAGVVNFILRKNYNGTEVSARIGGTTEGGGLEQNYNALSGVSRDGWYILGNVEYSKREAITAGDRNFTKDMLPLTTLLQPEERRSVFLSGGRELTSRISFSIDGLVSDRTSQGILQVEAPDDLSTSTNYTPSYSISSALDIGFSNSWKLRVTGVASGSRNNSWVRTASSASVNNYRNYVRYAEVTGDGVLFRGPGGEVKAAFGAGYREEGWQQNYANSPSFLEATRQVTYLYGEILAPLVSPSDARTGLQELELSVSGRAEDYSDFGLTTNPRIGLRYVPLSGLAVRATWGQSFKAPAFIQMYQDDLVFLFSESSFGGTGGGTGLMTWGGNHDLKPETSESWTLGADFTPKTFDTLKLSASYFNIDYTNRIVQPVANYFIAFSDPLYAPFVQTSPTPEVVSDLVSSAGSFYNFSGGSFDPSQVAGIVFNKYQNATSQQVRGFDAAYRQTFTLNRGTLGIFSNATWLRLEQQTIATMPSTVLSGTIYNAPKFKARGGLTWESGSLTATGIVNYISGAKDTGVEPNAHVASWTTVDATLTYRFGPDSGLNGVRAMLTAANLFDKDPPRTVSPLAATEAHFDSTNSSVIGRVVSVQISKAW